MFYEFDKIYSFLGGNDGYQYSLPICYYDAAKDLFDSIEKYLEKNPDYAKDFAIDQIKTKFQWIRVYYSPMNDEIDNMILKLCDVAAKHQKAEGFLLVWKKEDV